MPKKKTKKDLSIVISRLIAANTILEQKINSYNTLFSMYVKYKGEGVEFQKYLKEELEGIDAKIRQAEDKED